MTSTLRRPLTFAAHERATIGDSKFSFTDSDHLGWLKCDGRLLSTTDYALLYKVIGRSFTSAGVSSNLFSLPNALGRVPGAAGRPEPEDLSGSPQEWIKGDISGAQLHQLTIPEMPRHNHGVDGNDPLHLNNRTNTEGLHNHGGATGEGGNATESETVNGGGGANVSGAGSHTHSIGNDGSHYHLIEASGEDQYHNNMQPTIFMGNLFIFCGRYFQGVAPYTVNKGVY